MPRSPRIVVPGVAHHVTQRGIRRTPVFHDNEDRDFYTRVVHDNCSKYGVEVRAYCWMTNHIHLVGVPDDKNSFANASRRAHSTYARHFNAKYGFCGYLCQNRFYSCPLDDGYMWSTIRYVERNPVRAGMIQRAEAYPWSSARPHCTGEDDLLLTDRWRTVSPWPSWSEWLAAEEDEDLMRSILENTTKGYPCGEEDFVDHLESEFGRPLRTRKPGPPRRNVASSIIGRAGGQR